ncbi:SdrD B-like domain-containing protein [Methanobacterium sp. ACI-7]|uniref:SdrD B-like domain-containing protein n=1 Tax=unclassified Methanobacterium TaxID=2627676 RepID=UPI0039C3B78B
MKKSNTLPIILLVLIMTLSIGGVAAVNSEITPTNTQDSEESLVESNSIEQSSNDLKQPDDNNNKRHGNHDKKEDNIDDNCDEEDDNENDEDDNCDEEDDNENHWGDHCNVEYCIEGRAWNDTNANGIEEENETGLQGIIVNLWSGNQTSPIAKLFNTTTNATGYYSFNNLCPKTFWLEFVVPQGLGTWIFSPQNQGTNDTIDSDANASGIAGPVNLNRCANCQSNWDAGLYQYAQLGDRVWNDLNANGIQDTGEPGISGIVINLWSSVNNLPFNIVNTTTTDANGNYLFTNVVPGLYQLQYVVPQALGAWIFSPQNQGTNDTIDSDPAGNGITGVINLISGAIDYTWDAGLYQLAALGDRVWNDLNKNGIQDAGEPGVAGVTVNLWSNINNAPGSIIQTTTTDALGAYIFNNIVPGTYWLQFVLPQSISTWVFTLQNQGINDALDSDANALGIAGPIVLISGQVALNWDAGLDPGDAAAGGDEEPIVEVPVFAAGGEELIEIIEVPLAAAGEETIPMEETGLPIGLLVLAVLMTLGGMFRFKR